MSINWNYYLSCYQQARGGHFFGALEEDCDCHLVLTQFRRIQLLSLERK